MSDSKSSSRTTIQGIPLELFFETLGHLSPSLQRYSRLVNKYFKTAVDDLRRRDPRFALNKRSLYAQRGLGEMPIRVARMLIDARQAQPGQSTWGRDPVQDQGCLCGNECSIGHSATNTSVIVTDTRAQASQEQESTPINYDRGEPLDHDELISYIGELKIDRLEIRYNEYEGLPHQNAETIPNCKVPFILSSNATQIFQTVGGYGTKPPDFCYFRQRLSEDEREVDGTMTLYMASRLANLNDSHAMLGAHIFLQNNDHRGSVRIVVGGPNGYDPAKKEIDQNTLERHCQKIVSSDSRHLRATSVDDGGRSLRVIEYASLEPSLRAALDDIFQRDSESCTIAGGTEVTDVSIV